MFILYHPKVNSVDITPNMHSSIDWYQAHEGWTGEFTSPSFSVWMVPGTIDVDQD